jgi:hypothetical protein
MSVKFALTADESIVVNGINVLRIEKLPLPLKGMARSPIYGIVPHEVDPGRYLCPHRWLQHQAPLDAQPVCRSHHRHFRCFYHNLAVIETHLIAGHSGGA